MAKGDVIIWDDGFIFDMNQSGLNWDDDNKALNITGNLNVTGGGSLSDRISAIENKAKASYVPDVSISATLIDVVGNLNAVKNACITGGIMNAA